MNQLIKIHDRTLTPPATDDTNFTEVLSNENEVWAAVKTSTGIEVFSGTNLIGIATHFFYIRFITGLTSESWVEFKDSYYRILDIQNYQEADEFMVLRCVVRGDTTKAVNLA
jgi:SPP1 family predicted phage head-tail adaptor